MSPGCPACGFDGRKVSPSDAATALRSFPRRFTSALARPDSEDRPGDVLRRRPRQGGLSAIEHAAWVATGVGEAGEAFTAVMYHEDPAISMPALDPQPPIPGAAGGAGEAGPDSVVAAITAAATALASAIDEAPKDGWKRTGHAATGPVTALDVVTFAVHLGVHHLHLAELTISDVLRDLR